jgi:hypothetical protein
LIGVRGLLCVLPLLDAIDVNFVLRLEDGVIRPKWRAAVE